MSIISDLVNIEDFDKKDYFLPDRGEVSFYCKDCKKLVETDRPDDKGYVFICKICKGTNISIGTKEGLKTNYRLND